jgi:hypothetical protein
MPYGKGSEAEIEQRQNAAKKHGMYGFQERGEAALEKPNRSRLQELREQIQDRSGVVDLIQENAVKAVMMVELLTSYIANQKMLGVPLDGIPALRVLPGFMNSAQRALKDVISLMPSSEGVIDAEKILAEIKKRKDDDNEETTTDE